MFMYLDNLTIKVELVKGCLFVLVFAQLASFVAVMIYKVVHIVKDLIPVEEGQSATKLVRSRAGDGAADHSACVSVFGLILVGHDPEFLDGIGRNL